MNLLDKLSIVGCLVINEVGIVLSEDVLEVVQNDSDGMIAFAHVNIDLFDKLLVE